MIFRFSGLWLIKILKGSDIGPEIKPEAELGAETFVLFQNFSQALAAKAQGVSYVRVFGGPSLMRSDIELRLILPQGSCDFWALGQSMFFCLVDRLWKQGKLSHLSDSVRCEKFSPFWRPSIYDDPRLGFQEFTCFSRVILPVLA